jgi:ribosomal protein L11 methylase PrmA
MGILASLLLLISPILAQSTAPRPEVPYLPTTQVAVEAMLKLAGVTANDVVYDLGCGDGRIVITAAKKYGCNAVGYEIDPRLVQRSQEEVRRSKLEHLVRIEERDLFTADLGQADVVTLYLPGPLLEKLLPQFRQLKAGVRIVSHEFVIPGQQPEHTVRMTSTEDKTEHAIHLWTTPLKGTP